MKAVEGEREKKREIIQREYEVLKVEKKRVEGWGGEGEDRDKE